MPFIDKVISLVLSKGVIIQKTQLSGHTFHIRIHSESFKQASYQPGYFLRLFCGKGKDYSLKDKVRSYSVWNYDREQATIDIAARIHSNGPGAEWVKESKVNDEIYFNWHAGKFILEDSADSYLFIGDLSALGHLYEIRRNLSKGKKVKSIIYGPHASEFFADSDGSTPFDFYVMPENPVREIQHSLDIMLKDFTGSKLAYIGGDSRICVALHSFLKKQHQWQTKEIKAKPFWNPLKTGLE